MMNDVGYAEEGCEKVQYEVAGKTDRWWESVKVQNRQSWTPHPDMLDCGGSIGFQPGMVRKNHR